jgi:phosphoglycerol transferase MdoB-like AlkP superfamily enzyme
MIVAAALITKSGELDGSMFAVVGDHDVPENGENSVWHWHLHDEVGVMRYGHELGEHRSPEDGAVR